MELKNNFNIKDINLPENPGVYLMHNSKQKIIYIGKAKNLKKRVSSYFNKVHSDEKTKELVKNIADIETIICPSELDALILENNLIKKHLPKYNIMLKDEKAYPYIKFTKEKFPKISIIRTTKTLDTRNGYYFGPFPSRAWEIKKNLIKIFKIRDCNRDMKKTYRKPCLKYYINLCSGPCFYKLQNFENKYYETQINRAKKLLLGRGKELIKDMEVKMKEASDNMEFEKAIQYRNYAEQFKELATNQIIDSKNSNNENIFVFQLEGSRLFRCVLNITDGKLVEKKSTNMNLDNKIYSDLFQTVVTDYFSGITPADNITFEPIHENNENIKLISDYLSAIRSSRQNINEENNEKRLAKVKIHFPKIDSNRKRLLNMAIENLNKDMFNYYSKKSVIEDALFRLYEVLNLKKLPYKIECFDISNIQGKDAVASMSVAVDGQMSKKNYRKFKIRTKDTPDDFHMMREAITRRYSKLKEHELPNLILADGGLGQLNSVGAIIKSLDLDKHIDIISIAKREEEIFKFGSSIPFIFSRDEECLKILQRLRDEAHRFGITYHRKLRSKRIIKSELDDIPGIGSVRRDKLLNKFGSVKRIMSTPLEELKKIVPEKVAIDMLKSLKNK